MKIICSWCKSSPGEKCSQCGRVALRLSREETGDGLSLTGKRFYVCYPCARGWSEGFEKEETHGVCGECEEKVREGFKVLNGGKREKEEKGV